LSDVAGVAEQCIAMKSMRVIGRYLTEGLLV
jgi:hypothetical protein